MVRGASDAAIDALRSHPDVLELGIRTPGLEEIFVAYLAAAEPAVGTSAAAAEVVVP